MKYIGSFVVILVLYCAFSLPAFSQGDVRSATGLPIPIGADVIWGQIELRGLRPGQMKPVVTVILRFNGAQLATSQANDKGYYYFLHKPRDGSELAVSVGGIEVGRQIISSAGVDRYDMAVNWNEGSGRQPQTGVISVRNAYERPDASNKLFDRASAAAKAKNSDQAIKLYRELVAADPQDFVAWTELGSLYFEQSKFADGEDAYKRALELKVDFMPALMNLGKLYIADKQYPKGVPVLERAIVADPTSADAFHYLGEAYLLSKLGSKAVGPLNEALRLAPVEKADIHLRLGALYNAAGLKDRAAAEYKLFLVKKPEYNLRSKLEAYIKENSN